MDFISSVLKKIDLRSRNGRIYYIACALIIFQPVLDMISSAVLNAGRVEYISLSAVFRGIMMLGILVFSLVFYRGKYKTVFSVYLSAAVVYVFLVGGMTLARGTLVEAVYMIGSLIDLLFFAFAFISIYEVIAATGRRISPAVITATALIYTLSVTIRYLAQNDSFRFNSSFRVVLAIIIPSAVLCLASLLARKRDKDEPMYAKILGYVVPVVMLAVMLAGAVLSNSKPVFFSSVIFAAIIALWTFSKWRDNTTANRRLLKSSAAGLAFCVLVLALLPISPVNSSFDGTFSFSGLFYNYIELSGGDVEGPGGAVITPEEDDEDNDSDYVPNIDSGYDPRDHTTEEETTKKPERTTGRTNESTREPAGDYPGAQESTDWPVEDETAPWWQLPSSLPTDLTDVLNYLTTITMPQWRPTRPTSPATEGVTGNNANEEEQNIEPALDEANVGGRTGSFGFSGAQTMAIDINRVLSGFDRFTSNEADTFFFGLRYSSLFDDELSAMSNTKCDPVNVLYNYGAVGLLMFILPILAILAYFLKFLFFNIANLFDSIGCAVYVYTALLLFVFSVFDGNVLTQSAVGGIAAVLLANAVSVCRVAEEKQRRADLVYQQLKENGESAVAVSDMYSGEDSLQDGDYAVLSDVDSYDETTFAAEEPEGIEIGDADVYGDLGLSDDRND